MQDIRPDQVHLWTQPIDSRLQDYARRNDADGTMQPGQGCYYVGPRTGYPYVTAEQFESAVGAEPWIQSKYVTIANTPDANERPNPEWGANWNNPEYWLNAERTMPARADGRGIHWTTAERDPDAMRDLRRTALAEYVAEFAWDAPCEQESFDLYHTLAHDILEKHPDSDIGHYRIHDSAAAREELGQGLTDEEIAEKIEYGGWNPENDHYVYVNKDGDWVGADPHQADMLVWNHRAEILNEAVKYAHDLDPSLIGLLSEYAAYIDQDGSLDPWLAVEENGKTAEPATLPMPDQAIGQANATPGMGM